MNIFSKTLKLLAVVGAFSFLLASCGFGDGGSGNDAAPPTPTPPATTEWTISYSTAYGTAPASKTVEDGYKLTAADLPTLSKEGHVFSGWNKSVGFEIKANTTIVALWGDSSYTVTFDANGGSGTMESQSFVFGAADITLYAVWIDRDAHGITYNIDDGTNASTNPISFLETETVSLSDPAKANYTFKGWYAEEDYSGTAVTGWAAGDKTADVELYAKWEAVSYTITYNLNSGTNAASNPASFTVEDTVTLADPTKDGYTFKGWYTEEDYSGTAVTGWAAGEKTADVELYAKWRIDISLDEVKVTGTTFTGSDANKFWYSSTYAGAFTAARTITVKDYYIGKYELTKDQYKAIMSDTDLNTLGVSEDPSCSTIDPTTYKIADGETDGKRAVEGVTWYDAVYYCNLLSRNDGLTEAYTITSPAVSGGHITSAAVEPVSGADGWRLPTEIEWEFAARGGDPAKAEWNYEYAGADSSEARILSEDTALDAVGWYMYNTCNGGTTGGPFPLSGTAGFGAHQVGMKNANSLGLYDMSGNVFEWCWDWYGTIDTTTLFAGPPSGSRRVFRGDSWINDANFSCVAYRDGTSPGDRFINRGFRLVRSAQ